MPRYFLEVAYKGTAYSGFQVQENANSVQAEIENAFAIYFREKIQMTGSSRTDAGVHALQNFFHFDFPLSIDSSALYSINSILPDDIVAKQLYTANDESHCRFDATYREYQYSIYKEKDPFLRGIAHYFPYTLDMEKLREAAAVIMRYTDFTTFSKRNTQTKTFLCAIMKSEWLKKDNCYTYHVKANRFLRGMVRGLVGTMLQVGRGKININEFAAIIESRDCTQADFSVPAHGLFLLVVNYPDGMLSLIK